MPVLRQIRERFPRSARSRVSASRVHARDHRDGVLDAHPAGRGGRVALAASNPLSTQDDTAAALVHDTASPSSLTTAPTSRATTATSTPRSTSRRTRCSTTGATSSTRCTRRARSCSTSSYGGAEETTTGVTACAPWPPTGKLQFPIIAINDTETKDVRQRVRHRAVVARRASSAPRRRCWPARRSSSRATATAAGRRDARQGHGRQRRRHRDRADGGAQGDDQGFRVMPMDEAARIGDIFITVTGNSDILVGRHFDGR